MRIVADSKIPRAEEAFAPFGDVRVLPTQRIARENITDADAIFVRSETRIDADLLDGTHVQFVGTATIGTDHVDVGYVNSRGIAFASCPGSNAESVAEYFLAALLEAGARLGFALRGRTLGVVGHGNTGSRVARKATAVGMNVLLNDPPLARSTGDKRYMPLDALMSADVISLHVPLTEAGDDATFHLFDAKRLAAVKKGSILINASRGAVVDSNALKESVRRRHIDACVLDVWENEPRIDTELLQLSLLGTPHIAGYSYDGKLNATKMLRRALGEFLRVPVGNGLQFDEREEHILRLKPDSPDAESLLRVAVQACYAIAQDDLRLRKILEIDDAQRAGYFRELRATYPRRREFCNYAVVLEEHAPEVSRLLSSVGFRVQQS